MTRNDEELCINCIWWEGDSHAEKGACHVEGLAHSPRTARYDECIKFIPRRVDTGEDTLELNFD